MYVFICPSFLGLYKIGVRDDIVKLALYHYLQTQLAIASAFKLYSSSSSKHTSTTSEKFPCLSFETQKIKHACMFLYTPQKCQNIL